MRHLLFLAVVVGILCGVDAVLYHGKYRTAVWREVLDQGQAFSRGVDYQIAKLFNSRG
jgi:hypothetical protein